MTPEEVRRILDPERRRAGFEAEGGTVQWTSTPPVEPLHTSRVGDSGGTCASKGLDDVGQPQPAAAHPGEAESLSGFAAWLPTPEQTRRFWGDDPMGPRRELADEMQRQRDAAEAEMREALGRLVAIEVTGHVDCPVRAVSVRRREETASHVVTLRAGEWPGSLARAFTYTANPDPTMPSLDWLLTAQRGVYEADADVSDEWAAARLREVLGDECLAALQPKIERRGGAFVVTRKTLRKDSGG